MLPSVSQTIDQSNPYTAKLNRINFGAVSMSLNPITQNLEISQLGNQNPYFINSQTGHSNINIDLENKTITNLNITNLHSENITVTNIVNPQLQS
jgi:hypothetical protein